MPTRGLDGLALVVLLPLPITLAVSWIDLRRRIIPDLLNAALLGLGLVVAASDGPVLQAVAASLSEAGIAFLLIWTLRAGYGRLRGRIGLGLGDVKFITASAVWTGLDGLPVLILAASTAALCAILLASLAGFPIDRATRLPFGPFLALGLHVALIAKHTL